MRMKLKIADLKNKSLWEDKGYELPEFDIEKVKENTLNAPIWLHFGAGNLFRAFPAVLQQNLLNNGLSDKGIIVCESYDEEIIEKVYTPYDNLSLIVTLKPDGVSTKCIAVHAITASIRKNSQKYSHLITTNNGTQ